MSNSNELLPPEKRVARSTSADSAVELEDPLSSNSIGEDLPKRRLTLTVLDMPLRPALLPLPEPSMLPNCCERLFDDGLEGNCPTCLVPSKTILEAQLIELPIIPLDREQMESSFSRRESAVSGDGVYNENHVRMIRTPSVVVSDYSDDVVCGITLEEIEYFRRHRLGRRFSADGKGIDFEDTESDISAASSCSNLNYCGSHISILDGMEMSYEAGVANGVTGLKTPERKMSNSSTCSTLSGGEEEENNFAIKLADALHNEGETLTTTTTSGEKERRKKVSS